MQKESVFCFLTTSSKEIVSNVKELTTLFLFARRHPVFHAEDRLVSELLNYIQAVKLKILDLEHEFRRELVATMLKVLIYDMCNVIYRVQQVEKTGKSRGETIFPTSYDWWKRNTVRNAV